MTREEAAHIVDVAFGVPQAVRRAGEDRTYHEKEIREAKNMAIKALEQDVPGINAGDIYECPCGYGWDKSKVVRHHFCPNCGRAVDSSYNSIKPELKPCEDAISRQDAIKKVSEILKGVFVEYEDIAQKAMGLLPSVTPQKDDFESKQRIIDAITAKIDEIDDEKPDVIIGLITAIGVIKNLPDATESEG